MPHVLASLAYARHCFRKRPFESKEAALTERSEDFDTYRCRYCGKWHRTSKPHLKQRLIAQKKRERTKVRVKALRKRAIIKEFYEH
jgi:hypothetical protein